MTALGPVAQSLENADKPKTRVSDWSLYDLQRQESRFHNAWRQKTSTDDVLIHGAPDDPERQVFIRIRHEDAVASVAKERALAQFESMRADQNNRSRGSR